MNLNMFNARFSCLVKRNAKRTGDVGFYIKLMRPYNELMRPRTQ